MNHDNDSGALGRLGRRLEGYRFAPRIGDRGWVESVGDGIAWVHGLPSAAAEGLVRFEDGSRGLAFELQAERIGVILLDPYSTVSSGSLVSHSSELLTIGVGDALLGRVVDPLGRPLDGQSAPRTEAVRALEGPSPALARRAPVTRPLYTGTKVVDTLIPIGRGQRQLLIGDAGTGKTSLAIDTVISQAGQKVHCVYAMIGQKRSETAALLDTLRRHGALDYTTVVVAEATATPGMKYLAPFAACAVAEAWMAHGEDTLVIYDDLSTHARAYRELSLLMLRPPGREAYPGDIFYLHARLLERSTCLPPELGGGSLTALPIVETEEGEIAAFIPTNLISITDGQIYLDPRLFAAGVLPAVDVPLSVSRIGGKAQHPRIKEEAAQMKLDYLQFLELEAFTRFGMKLEAGTEARIRRGRILREVLKQELLQPKPATFQLAWMIAYNDGMLASLEPEWLRAHLRALQEGLAAAPLPLDAPRSEWSARVRAWLGDDT